MPRAKPLTYRQFKDRERALEGELLSVRASVRKIEKQRSCVPGQDVTFRRGAVEYKGTVGQLKTTEAGDVVYFIYVPNSDGFGQTGSAVASQYIVVELDEEEPVLADQNSDQPQEGV